MRMKNGVHEGSYTPSLWGQSGATAFWAEDVPCYPNRLHRWQRTHPHSSKKERAVDLLNPHAMPPIPRPGYPAHLLQGEGEVGGLSSLTGLQQQLFLALAEQGNGA